MAHQINKSEAESGQTSLPFRQTDPDLRNVSATAHLSREPRVRVAMKIGDTIVREQVLEREQNVIIGQGQFFNAPHLPAILFVKQQRGQTVILFHEIRGWACRLRRDGEHKGRDLVSLKAAQQAHEWVSGIWEIPFPSSAAAVIRMNGCTFLLSYVRLPASNPPIAP